MIAKADKSDCKKCVELLKLAMDDIANFISGSDNEDITNFVLEDLFKQEQNRLSYENVLVKPAWTEKVPVYEERARDICNDCNKDLTDLSEKDFKAHGINHIKNGGKGSWRTEWKKVQVGTKTVKHEAVYKKKWVVDKKAYDETITTGYKCSCGATK